MGNPELVLVITWRESGDVHSEAFGTWTAQDDGSHLAQIDAFTARWNTAAESEGKTPVAAVLYLISPVTEKSADE
jgi:hypothetical protein